MLIRSGRGVLVGLLFYTLFSVMSFAFALEVPPLRGRVNDLAGMLSSDQARALEQELTNFERETGHQIAVLTIPTLAGDALEDFSIRVAENWKIGQKGFDNGAILIVVRDDRKLRIEVGYGLEGVLPDAIASRIIREAITPRFRSGDFGGGIEAGIDAILKVTKGEVLPERARTRERGSVSNISVFGTVLIMTALLALFLGMTQRSLGRGSLGGTVAGLLTTLGTAPGYSLPLWVLASIVGAILGAMGSRFASASWGGHWTGRPQRYRGGWGGGGFGSGGGFGGGGFGGGGGGFGGGGASGSW